jgi:DNA-binding NarL/FixJ family response regulator
VNLPNVDSLEACREMTRVNPTIKVIMFTAMADPDAGQAFVEAGACAFVSKVASDDLLSIVKRLCADRS